MGWLAFIYFIVVTFTAIPAIWRGDIALGASGLVAPILCMIAGGAIPDGLRDRTIPTSGVLIVAAALIGGSLYWISSTGWHVRIGSLDISGVILCIIGIVVGWLFEGAHHAQKVVAAELASRLPAERQ